MEPARESIFASSIRALCKAFAIIIGIFIACVPIFMLFGLMGKNPEHTDKTAIHYLPDLNGNSDMTAASAPVVLQINVHGVIGKEDDITADDVRYQLIESRRGMLAKDRVRAVFLNMKTPGGSALDSDTIYRLISEYKEKYKVPVYAFVDGLCASGGMYISSSADKIYSTPVAMIGSIGVIMGPFFNFTEVMSKIGIKSETLTQGKDKDMMNPFREWRPNEDDSLKTIGKHLYDVFVDIVTTNRTRVNKEKLINEYGAHVFDPEQAEEIGYIDVANSSYNQALHDLLVAAKIDPNSPYQVIELRIKKNWLQDIFQGKSPITSGKIKHEFNLGGSDIQQGFSYLYQPGNSQPILVQ